jgi:hypothetical protein
VAEEAQDALRWQVVELFYNFNIGRFFQLPWRAESVTLALSLFHLELLLPPWAYGKSNTYQQIGNKEFKWRKCEADADWSDSEKYFLERNKWKLEAGLWQLHTYNSTVQEKEDSKCLVRVASELQSSLVKKGELKNISKSHVSAQAYSTISFLGKPNLVRRSLLKFIF